MDPALIRPGRVDVKEKIDYCSDYQLKEMFKKFYPHTLEENAEKFCLLVRKHTEQVSAAQLQGFFLFYKDNAGAALENVSRIKTV